MYVSMCVYQSLLTSWMPQNSVIKVIISLWTLPFI